MRRLLAIVALALAAYAVAPVAPAAADIVSDIGGFTCAITRNTNNPDHTISHAHIKGVGPGWTMFRCQSFKGVRVCSWDALWFNPGYNGGPGGPFGPIDQVCRNQT